MLVDCMDYSKLVRGRINDMVHVYREREGGGGPNRMGKEKKKKGLHTNIYIDSSYYQISPPVRDVPLCSG